jgi:branched-chain amino acid transport system permease protein
LGALTVSGAFAGLAGALFAYHSGIIAPNNIGIAASGLLVLMVILGGSGSTYGALAGGIIVTAVQFYASEWSEQRAPMIIGAVFIVTALFLRGGLAGAIRRRTRPTEVVVDGPVAR